jgi:hypothetical protein
VIACDLSALSTEQRVREQVLLAEFKGLFREAQETDQGYSVAVPADPHLLSRLGEFLALERLCCPFLTFHLSVPADRGVIALQIHGPPGAKAFLRSEFLA